MNDPNQATPLHVRYVAVYNFASTQAQTQSRVNQATCIAQNDASVLGVWYGNSLADRSGNNWETAEMAAATLAGPTSSGATGLSHSCG